MRTTEKQFGLDVTVISEKISINDKEIIDVDPRIIAEMKAKLAGKDQKFLDMLTKNSVKPKRFF